MGISKERNFFVRDYCHFSNLAMKIWRGSIAGPTNLELMSLAHNLIGLSEEKLVLILSTIHIFGQGQNYALK